MHDLIVPTARGALALVFATLLAGAPFSFSSIRARCAPGFYAEGVRPSGASVCRRPPRGLENDGADQLGSYEMRIYCTGGAHPIIVDARTVGCQR